MTVTTNMQGSSLPYKCLQFKSSLTFSVCSTTLVCCLLFYATLAPSVACAQSKPNIVFIMADDLGWADVAFHGGNAPTPNLDRLAEQGLELTQHYVAPVCSPTRSALMTGRCWSRWGVVNPQNELALPSGTPTIASHLKSIGYETCITGKWHLGSLPEWGPNHYGFDHSYGSLAGGVSPWNHFYKQGPYTKTWHRDESLITESGHVTDLIQHEAVKWIESRREKPFFLYVPFTAVHLPVKEPPLWLDKVPSSIDGDVPRHYAASIMHLDDAVGKILSALESSGKRENTIVVFTSDNGGSTAQNNDLKYPDDNCPNGKLPGNNAPWRGEKGSLYEGGTKVPTIVHWPEKIMASNTSHPGGKFNTPAQIIDWMPTFCELAGLAKPADLDWDGVSLAAALLHGQPIQPRSLYSVAPSWRASSIRFENWKLISNDAADGEKKLELYDLSEDPYETTNLADKSQERVEQMLTLLRDAHSKDGKARKDRK